MDKFQPGDIVKYKVTRIGYSVKYANKIEVIGIIRKNFISDNVETQILMCSDTRYIGKRHIIHINKLELLHDGNNE